MVAEVAELAPMTWGAIVAAAIAFFGGANGVLKVLRVVYARAEHKESVIVGERQRLVEVAKDSSNKYREVLVLKDQTFSETLIKLKKEESDHVDRLVIAWGQNTKKMLDGLNCAIEVIRDEARISREAQDRMQRRSDADAETRRSHDREN
jgi:hypothetical protein